MTNRQSNHVRRVKKVRWAAGALALGLAIVGCAAELDRSQDYDWAYADSQGGSGNQGGGSNVPQDPPCLTKLMNDKCTLCHFSGASADLGKELDLQSPNLGQRLVNKASKCGDPPIVDPSNKSNSSLLLRVTGMAKGCAGSVMPPGGPLSGNDLKCVQDWINSF